MLSGSFVYMDRFVKYDFIVEYAWIILGDTTNFSIFKCILLAFLENNSHISCLEGVNLVSEALGSKNWTELED